LILSCSCDWWVESLDNKNLSLSFDLYAFEIQSPSIMNGDTNENGANSSNSPVGASADSGDALFQQVAAAAAAAAAAASQQPVMSPPAAVMTTTGQEQQQQTATAAATMPAFDPNFMAQMNAMNPNLISQMYAFFAQQQLQYQQQQQQQQQAVGGGSTNTMTSPLQQQQFQQQAQSPGAPPQILNNNSADVMGMTPQQQPATASLPHPEMPAGFTVGAAAAAAPHVSFAEAVQVVDDGTTMASVAAAAAAAAVGAGTRPTL
jgi:hypothetical protein